MRGRSNCFLIALGVSVGVGTWLGCPAESLADPSASDSTGGAEKKSAYGERGTFEFGGAISAEWTSDLFVLDVGPQFGYFIRERIELSLLVDLIYENAREPDGTRIGTLFTSALLEPSYHPAVSESIAGLGGLGVGFQRETGHTLFELAPRLGLNFLVGNAVLTPAVTMPILIGDKSGNGTTQVAVGVLAELEVSVAW
jgi:hypothetical protein